MEKWYKILNESLRRLLDNTVAESFFSTIKAELIYQKDYKTRKQARQDTFEYIAVYYNRIRMHSTLNYKSPEDYENKGKLSKLCV